MNFLNFKSSRIQLKAIRVERGGDWGGKNYDHSNHSHHRNYEPYNCFTLRSRNNNFFILSHVSELIFSWMFFSQRSAITCVIVPLIMLWCCAPRCCLSLRARLADISHHRHNVHYHRSRSLIRRSAHEDEEKHVNTWKIKQNLQNVKKIPSVRIE